MQPRTRPVKILFAEHHSEYARMLSEAFADLPTLTEIHHVDDGRAAVDFVSQTGSYASAPRPDMILLGLELPPESGKEILKKIKLDKNLRAIPVIVFASSEESSDRIDCYNLGANAYVRKPSDPDQFRAAVEVIERFWMRTARLPGLQEMNFFSTGASFS